MMRHMTSALLPGGRRMHFVQGMHESRAEFDGRVLCAIEDAILQGAPRPVPKGTRWAEWWHHGYVVREFMANGLGSVRESTGELYQDRTVLLPGIYNEEQAQAKLREAPTNA